MAAKLDETNGIRAAFARKSAWHKDGEVFTEKVSPVVFIGSERGARMDYRVIKSQAYQSVIVVDDDGPKDGFALVENQYHLVRSDDNRIVSPSTVTDRYTPVCPTDLLEILTPFEEQGYGSMESAFVLKNGTEEVLSLRLDMGENVYGDDSKYDTYLVVHNSHGLGSIKLKLTQIRVVCNNTLTAAFSGGCDRKMHHTESVKDKIKFAANYWEEAQKTIKNHADRLGKLAKANGISIPATIDEMLETLKNNGKPMKEGSTQLKNRRERLVDAANNSPGAGENNLLSIYHGITSVNSHDDNGKGGKTPEDRFSSILSGSRGTFEAETFNWLEAKAIDLAIA